MASFEVGDVVQLKSGGPVMTVQDSNACDTYGKHGFIACVYFDGPKRHEERFLPQMLEVLE